MNISLMSCKIIEIKLFFAVLLWTLELIELAYFRMNLIFINFEVLFALTMMLETIHDTLDLVRHLAAGKSLLFAQRARFE